LTAVRNAFSSRGSVLEKSDTNPRVILLVLSYLRGKVVSNPGIGKRIAYLEGCVNEEARVRAFALEPGREPHAGVLNVNIE
jgi:hypothetical protein